jgi:beta-lactamase class A
VASEEETITINPLELVDKGILEFSINQDTRLVVERLGKQSIKACFESVK